MPRKIIVALCAIFGIMAIGLGVFMMTNQKVNDTDFKLLWNNFTEQDVAPKVNLDNKTKAIVTLGALIATQSQNLYTQVLQTALTKGDISAVEAKEIVYQSVAYVGYAKAYDFFFATHKAIAAAGVDDNTPPQSTTDIKNRFDKGLAVQKHIFGEVIDLQYQNSSPEQLHIQKFLSANCFGDYYTRRGLDLNQRELLTFAILISLGGADAQVKGHIKGNYNIGNSKQLMLDTITYLLPYIGYPRSLNAISALNEVIPQNKEK